MQRSSMKRFAEWKCLALILSEEISDSMYLSSQGYKKRFAQNDAGSITCFIVTFSVQSLQKVVIQKVVIIIDMKLGPVTKPNKSKKKMQKKKI